MKSIRQLETSTKLFACFAIVLLLGVLMSAWLLGELAQMSDLAAHAGQKANAAAAALARAEFASARSWSFGFLALELTVAVLLCLWLAAEVARPVHEAVLVARRVAEGDLSNRIVSTARGEAGLLLRTMQEMNDKLVGIVVGVAAAPNRSPAAPAKSPAAASSCRRAPSSRPPRSKRPPRRWKN